MAVGRDVAATRSEPVLMLGVELVFEADYGAEGIAIFLSSDCDSQRSHRDGVFVIAVAGNAKKKRPSVLHRGGFRSCQF